MVEPAPFDIYLCDNCDAELYSKEAILVRDFLTALYIKNIKKKQICFKSFVSHITSLSLKYKFLK